MHGAFHTSCGYDVSLQSDSRINPSRRVNLLRKTGSFFRGPSDPRLGTGGATQSASAAVKSTDYPSVESGSEDGRISGAGRFDRVASGFSFRRASRRRSRSM
jgi:hypothetical protein